MVFCQFYKKIERSDSLTLVILAHFRHSYIPLTIVANTLKEVQL